MLMASIQDQRSRVDELSAAKRKLLEKWRATNPVSSAKTISRRSSAGPAPLSFTQQRLWFLDQLEPQNPFYNVATAVRLTGQLDVAVLELALQAVIARHDILRTTFHKTDGLPSQVIAQQIDWRIERAELKTGPDESRDTAWRRLAEAESLRPFDLQQGPLVRATLVHLGPLEAGGPDEHVLLLTMHHIICDGWSMAVLRHEVARYYEAILAGHETELEPLPIQYADFAHWQREQLQGPTLDRLLGYWTRQFANPPPPLELPLDFPRPATQTYAGNVCRRRVGKDLAARLREVARTEGATLFMVLETALHLALARFSGQRDICIGTPVANRHGLQLESLIGFFANTLALRADLSGNPQLREFLQQVRQTTLDAFAHQELPFEQLVDELKLPRDLSRTPLFQVMFVLQNIPLRAQPIAGLTATDVSFDHAPVSTFDLTLNVQEHSDGLDLSLIYNTDLFAPATIERLLSAYEMLLRIFGDNLDRPVLELPILSTADQSALQAMSVGPQQDFPQQLCIHDLIAEQSRRTPEAIAVRSEAQRLTYAELEARSNQLANYLAARGVGPDVAVGLFLERSVDLIVALVGILKAGGAYVPLDPAYPRSRLEFMARDAGLGAIVSSTEFIDLLPDTGVTTILVDRDAAEIASADDRPPANNVQPHHLAYIIYTSGSTGVPKGAEVEHRGLVNHAVVLAQRLQLASGDALLLYLSPSFDAAGEEIFPALVSGATLVLHSAPAELSGRALLEWSEANRVNLLHVTPAVWMSMVDEVAASGAALARHLKATIAGGDNVSRQAIDRWHQLTEGRVPFFLAYGVTEATITTTLGDSRERVPASDSERLPIGRPIANNRAYVLDEFRQPVPPGVAGEIYLGGVGVARGYRNRPELTSERFVADPFAEKRGARMYKTGDRGRWLADGQLEFLGRFDQQVKIRGYRIEPGEIESALGRWPAIREAAVVAVADATGHKRLVAYVATGEADKPEDGELRRFLSERLPPHMIPAQFVVLDDLPRLPNGKVNRHALPAVTTSLARHRDIVSPRNETEAILCEIWTGVLGLPQISVEDNFFEIGGDSIRSIQVVARARDAGLRFTPKQLFQHQSIAELAQVAERATVVCAEQGPVTGSVPLTPIQHEFFAIPLADRHHFNQSVMLELRRPLPVDLIETALQELIAHHDALRLRFVETSPEVWQQTGMPVERRTVVEVVNLKNTPASELVAAIESSAAVAQASLTIDRGELVRAVYFDLGERRPAQLLITIHHLAVDGVSWRILLEDLCLVVEQLSRGGPVQLPPKTTSFAEWSNRLSKFADDSTLRAELSHWAKSTATRMLLPENSTQQNLVADEATFAASLPAEETSRWLFDSHTAYRTRPHELLIAALAEALTNHLGSDTVCLELEGHGREDLFEDIDLSRTIGWFTAIYPREVKLPASGQAGDVVKSVKEQLRSTPRGGIGFGLLRWLSQDAHVRRQMAAVARGEISFNYLGQFDNLLPTEVPLALCPASAGPDRSPHGKRPHVWEIIAYVQQGRLHLSWRYSTKLHSATAIERLVHDWLAALRRLIDHCLDPDAGGATPSDFPLAALDQSELDQLANLLADSDGT